jgi:hypothetical protein
MDEFFGVFKKLSSLYSILSEMNPVRVINKKKLRGLSSLAKYTDRGCRVVSATGPYGRILGFLDRSRYFFFQVAPQLCSRG